MARVRIVEYASRPDYLRKFHGWATIVWFLLSFPLAYKFGSSVIFVTFLSLYAIVTGHWSAWQAARVEVKQDLLDPDTPTDHYK